MANLYKLTKGNVVFITDNKERKEVGSKRPIELSANELKRVKGLLHNPDNLVEIKKS